MTTDREWAMINKGYEIRKAHRNTRFLHRQAELRYNLAHYGWYEFPEPEEGEGESIANAVDLETSIRGYIMDDHVVFDPGEDYVQVKVNDYPNFALFRAALHDEFNKLVKVWYPE